MRISRTGLVLAGLYAIPSIVLVAMALTVDDHKGRFILLQLPLIPAVSLIGALGLSPHLSWLSWPLAYSLLMPLQLAVLYGLGKLMSWAHHRELDAQRERQRTPAGHQQRSAAHLHSPSAPPKPEPHP